MSTKSSSETTPSTFEYALYPGNGAGEIKLSLRLKFLQCARARVGQKPSSLPRLKFLYLSWGCELIEAATLIGHFSFPAASGGRQSRLYNISRRARVVVVDARDLATSSLFRANNDILAEGVNFLFIFGQVQLHGLRLTHFVAMGLNNLLLQPASRFWLLKSESFAFYLPLLQRLNFLSTSNRHSIAVIH
jgi:hypothetical protein